MCADGGAACCWRGVVCVVRVCFGVGVGVCVCVCVVGARRERFVACVRASVLKQMDDIAEAVAPHSRLQCICIHKKFTY